MLLHVTALSFSLFACEWGGVVLFSGAVRHGLWVVGDEFLKECDGSHEMTEAVWFLQEKQIPA